MKSREGREPDTRVYCIEYDQVAGRWTRLGAGPKWAVPTVLYFAVAVTVHFVHYPQFVIRQLPYVAWATTAGFLLAGGVAAYTGAFLTLTKGLKERRLVTSGLYSVVRHPLYSSSILFILPGVALLLRSWLLLPMPVVAYIAARVFIPAEEAQLRRRFGEAFEDYQRRTNPFLPKLWHRQRPA